MNFTIDADSDLARAITVREGQDMTLSIIVHDRTYSDVEKLVTARLMGWTLHAGCAHSPKTLEVEWMDTAKLQLLAPIPDPT